MERMEDAGLDRIPKLLVGRHQFRDRGPHLLGQSEHGAVLLVDRAELFRDRGKLVVVPDVHDLALEGALVDHVVEGGVDHGAFVHEDDHPLMDGPRPGVLVQLHLACRVVLVDRQIEEAVDGLGGPSGGCFQHLSGLVGRGRHDHALIFRVDPDELTGLVVARHDLVNDVAHPVGLADTGRAGQDEFLLGGIEQKAEECLSRVLLPLVQIILCVVHGFPFPDWVFTVRGCLVIP